MSAGLAAAAGLLAVAIPVSNAGPTPGAGEPAASAESAHLDSAVRGGQPNIVLITTDDERLRDQAFMPKTNRLIGDHGVTMTGVSPHPLCCPARAQILTGQFAQNNGVRTNKGPFGGHHRLDTSRTLPLWLQAAGYTTAFLGKYLNGYERVDTFRREPGWDSWQPTVSGVYQYYDFVVRRNGPRVTVPNRYQTDYFTAAGVAELERLAAEDEPFFMWQSYVAPHDRCARTVDALCFVPPAAAPRHRSLFQHTPLDSLRKPSFNEADMSDKPAFLARKPRFNEQRIRKLERKNRLRLQALQAVDEGVAKMLDALRRAGELDNTLVIFTSDNGVSMGEHRLANKIFGYEEPLRVPFLMRGPGIPVDKRVRSVAATVDIAPTIIAASGAHPTLKVDGRNLIPIANGQPGWATLLIQDGPINTNQNEVGWLFRGVRTARYTYMSYPGGKRELYDRLRDPFEIDSVVDSPAYAAVRHELVSRLRTLRVCAGAQCRQHFGPVPAPLG